jgi:hypothetical protein
MEYNFEKYKNFHAFRVPYDVNSIMHYSSYAFSKNQQPTILTKVNDGRPFLKVICLGREYRNCF